MEPVSVVIPVGSDPCYLEFLPECIESVCQQSYKAKQIIIVSDNSILDIDNIGKHLNKSCLIHGYYHDHWYFSIEEYKQDCVFYSTLWKVGVSDAFNFGIALLGAGCDLAFMLGSDDKMMPTCLEKCVQSYEKHQKEGWYFVKYQLQSGDILHIQNNTAMVTKKLWEELGGFPPSAGVGACDALLLSIMMKHMPDRIIPVESDEPLCWLREGDHQDTRKNGWLFSTEIVSIRNKETERWKPKN